MRELEQLKAKVINSIGNVFSGVVFGGMNDDDEAKSLRKKTSDINLRSIGIYDDSSSRDEIPEILEDIQSLVQEHLGAGDYDIALDTCRVTCQYFNNTDPNILKADDHIKEAEQQFFSKLYLQIAQSCDLASQANIIDKCLDRASDLSQSTRTKNNVNDITKARLVDLSAHLQ